MVTLRHLVVGAMLALLSVLAHAQAGTWEYSGDAGDALPWTTNAAGACTALAATKNSSTFSVTSNGPRNMVNDHYTQCSLAFVDVQSGETVDANSLQGLSSRFVPGMCLAGMEPGPDGHCVCKAGTHDVGGGCIPNDPGGCNANLGKTGIVNWTAGWQRTPSVGDRSPLIAPNNPGAGGTVCVAGCSQSFDAGAACPECKSYVSKTPNAQGLYRVSIDFAGTGTGASCTQGAADAPVVADDSKDPPCPGYVGDVNDVKGCYGTADKPVVSQPNNTPAGNPQVSGNPAAGAKPSVGEGSGSGGVGRTPTTGTGGSSGGPAATAGVGTGDGTVKGQGDGSGRVGTQDGTEQQACGAPGQPVCDVKIKEGEMPGTDEVFKGSNESLDRNAEADAKAIHDKATQEYGPMWTFDFQLPTGCTPFQVASFKGTPFTLDPCAYQGVIHDLMSMVWAAVTAFCLIGMVGRTYRST